MFTPNRLGAPLQRPPSSSGSQQPPLAGQAPYPAFQTRAPSPHPPPLPHSYSDGAVYYAQRPPPSQSFSYSYPYGALPQANGTITPVPLADQQYSSPYSGSGRIPFPEPHVAPPALYPSISSPTPSLPPKPSSLVSAPPVQREYSASWLTLTPTPVEPEPAAAQPWRSVTDSPKPIRPPKPADITPSADETLPQDDDDEELKRVLELSMREDEMRRQQAADQEEEEFARALEQSMRMTQGYPGGPNFDDIYENVGVGGSPLAGPSDIASASTEEPAESSSQPQSARSSLPGTAPYVNGVSHSPGSSRRSSNATLSRGPTPQPMPDSAGALSCEIPEDYPPTEDALLTARPLDSAPPPQAYLAQSAPTPPRTSFLQSSPDPAANAGDNTVPAIPPYGRSMSADPMVPRHAPQLTTSNSEGSYDLLDSPVEGPDHAIHGTGPAADKVVVREASPALGDQYIDPSLLVGVELGQGVPSISPDMVKLDPLPGVIQLPYGAHPPFFIRAPSWRGLLKLMASLRRTRIEPSVQAIFDSKSSPILRVVVCFVKVHSGSNDWLTVLFMTLDQPVPAQLQLKYRNGDTTALPYSYTLSSPLPMLRDGADAAMSKYYTVPPTHRAFLQLPTDFPTLASYLAEAVDISRNAPAGESALGLRRLAKMVDAFYPLDTPLPESPVTRFGGGMGNKLLGMMGMKRKHDRDRNAETYQLVTPFVPDEFGR